MFFVCLNIAAQNKVRVYGYVIDSNNRGIELANVYSGTAGTSTNPNGYYELTLDVRDSAFVSYSMVGYYTVRLKISASQKIQQVSVVLYPSSNEIKGVDVLAQRRQTSSFDRIDPKNYKIIPNANGGIESLLMTFAGVNQNNEFSSQYNVRGGNYDENIVYVNGIEIYRPLLIRAGQQEGLSFVNPDMVKNLSFSSGGFEARYGDKMSSVLDIEYKKPDVAGASVSAGLLGASAYVATAGKRFTQMHGIRYKSSAYLLGSLDTKAEYNPDFIDYQTYLTYDLSPRYEMTFLGNFSQNNYRFTPISRSTSYGTYNTPREMNIAFEGWENDVFRTLFGAWGLNYKGGKNVKMNLTASVFNTNENETYDILGEYVLSEVKTDLNDPDKLGATLGIGKYQEHARNRLKATVVALSHNGEAQKVNHLLKWGANFQLEDIKDKISEWEWRDSAGYSLPYNNRTTNLYYTLKSTSGLTSFRTTGYFQDTYKWTTAGGVWTATGGLRANYWTFNQELLVSPRMSMAWLPAWKKDFTFRLAAGVYYQSPFYKEIRDTLTDALGNVNVKLNNHIKAQRSWQLVLGGDHHFRAWGRPFKFTVEAYLKLADRVISYTVDNVRIRYSGENDAKAYTTGVDFKLFGELVPGNDSWINFSLMNSKEDIIGDAYTAHTYDDEGNVLTSKTVYPGWISRPNEQRYSFSMFFQDYFPNNPKYKVHLKAIWADGLPFSAPRSVQYRSAFRAPAYGRVDLGASRVFESGKDKLMNAAWLKHVENIGLNLEVFNLFDFRNVNSYYWVTDIYGYQNAVPNYLTGRQINLKVSVDFK